ncbi:MAG: hypothetical protein R3C14_35530 [Caldilineaceae bacterium]
MGFDNPIQESSAHTLILWGAAFEEMAAVIFATQLRRQGLPVKIVGLVGPPAMGEHGITVRPDLTLSEAMPMARCAKCVILPCSPATARRIENDPRLPTFFAAAASNHALFILSEIETIQMTVLRTLPLAPHQVLSYANHVNLIELASCVGLTLKTQRN